MKLFIQIKDGLPFGHPILETNFIQAFPNIDVNNLPAEFAIFERVPQPNTQLYEIYDKVTYEWVDGIVKDVHHFKPMTEEQRNKYDELEAEKLAAWKKENKDSVIGATRV
jgi:hypothetical protein